MSLLVHRIKLRFELLDLHLELLLGGASPDGLIDRHTSEDLMASLTDTHQRTSQ